ncbi:MAG: hypothetical protein ABGY41_02180, partial [Candidatus Poribacteria bacterium]
MRLPPANGGIRRQIVWSSQGNTMLYRPLGGISVSALALGGHEYLTDGRSRGFNEDRGDATKAGYIGEGYGGPGRRETLQEAYRLGINFLDVTIDPEQEAVGRNLR